MKLYLVLGLSLAVGLLELFLIKLPTEVLAIMFFSTIVFPAVFVIVLAEYSEYKKKEELEHFIPYAALQLSSFPQKTPTDVLIKRLKEGNFGVLSQVFSLVEKRINSGSSVQTTLSYSGKESNSILFKRFCSLLILSHRSGGDISNAFKSFADDAFALQNLKKDSAAAIAIQKYTLLFAGGIIAPAILSTLLTVSRTLTFDSPSFIGLSLSEKQSLIQAVTIGSYLYLIAFSLLASFFLSVTESSKRKALIYAFILLPVSLTVFTLIRGW